MESGSATENENSNRFPPKNNINGEGKKKQGFFRSTLSMLRCKPSDLDKQKQLKHVNTNTPKRKPLRAVRSVENFDNIFLPPPSPTYSTESRGSTMNQYASATDLHELEKAYGGGRDYEVNDSFFDKHSADVMIDTKAEQFISQFYEQMRSQVNPNQVPSAATETKISE